MKNSNESIIDFSFNLFLAFLVLAIIISVFAFLILVPVSGVLVNFGILENGTKAHLLFSVCVSAAISLFFILPRLKDMKPESKKEKIEKLDLAMFNAEREEELDVLIEKKEKLNTQ